MTLFEKELRQMFGDTNTISEPKICGKTMLGKLDDDLRIKLSFVTGIVANQYNAIRLSIINRTDGVVDNQVFKFSDIIGFQQTGGGNKISPHIWDIDNNPRWYIPVSQSDKAKIADTVLEYAEMYHSESQDFGITM